MGWLECPDDLRGLSRVLASLRTNRGRRSREETFLSNSKREATEVEPGARRAGRKRRTRGLGAPSVDEDR